MSRYPEQPTVAPPGSWHFPTPTRSALSNELDLVVCQLPGQHVVAGHLVLPLGLENEDRAYEGVATITARSLDEGTHAHPGEEFAELLETEGAGFGIDVSLSGSRPSSTYRRRGSSRHSRCSPKRSSARRWRTPTSTGTSRCGSPRSNRRRRTLPSWRP